MSNLADALVDGVLKSLAQRSGFDHWWDDLTVDVQLDIVADLEDVVGALLQAEGVE